MFQQYRPLASANMLALALLFDVSSASAQTTVAADQNRPTGQIDFAVANLPPATVEVDLSRSIFSDLFGLGDAAIEGIVESLLESNAAQKSDSLELAAGELAAARQILQLSKEVIHEVHVRVYDNFPEDQGNAAQLAGLFDSQLKSGQWDNVVKVNDGDDSVRVSLLRVDGSILGVFAIVADGNDVVLANLVCDVSPENIKKLTAAATKIGLDLGLREAIEQELQRHVHKLHKEQ